MTDRKKRCEELVTLFSRAPIKKAFGREPLRAVGRVLRAGQSLAVAEMEVRSLSGRLVATGSGTFAVTSLDTEKGKVR